MALDFDPHAGDAEPELLDRIDALRVLRADSPEEKGRLLEEIGGPGKAEQDIVDQLAKIKPLWQPAQFPEAHRMAMRSLEVLDRNGVRNAPMPKPLGPLKPVAGVIVQLVTRWIVLGAAGDPPSDHSYHFALVALVLLVVAALAIPLVASSLF